MIARPTLGKGHSQLTAAVAQHSCSKSDCIGAMCIHALLQAIPAEAGTGQQSGEPSPERAYKSGGKANMLHAEASV